MDPSTCIAYKCPKCTGLSMQNNPCPKCKLQRVEKTIPIEGKRLLATVDRLNTVLTDYNQSVNELFGMLEKLD